MYKTCLRKMSQEILRKNNEISKCELEDMYLYHARLCQLREDLLLAAGNATLVGTLKIVWQDNGSCGMEIYHISCSWLKMSLTYCGSGKTLV